MEYRDSGMENNGRSETEDIKLHDCPEDLDEAEPTRVVSQIINSTFYRWKEFGLDDSGKFCIVLEKPIYRQLTAKEAKQLLEASGDWVKKDYCTDEGYTLEPTDPRLDVPPEPLPFIEEPDPNDNDSEKPESSVPNLDNECKK